MSENNDFVLSDEAIAEQEKTANGGETLRADIAESLGLTDDESNKDILDKAIEREQNLRSGYGKLNKNYIDLRKAYKDTLKDPRLKQKDGKTEFDPEKLREETRAETINVLNEQFLDESEFSDDFKGKIREELTRNPGKTAQSVLKNSDFLKFYKDKEDEARRVAEAANNGNGQGGTTTTEKGAIPDKFNDPKFMATEAGRKEFDEWSNKR